MGNVQFQSQAIPLNFDWKPSVRTYLDILIKYPNPKDGWTVNVMDTDYTYRYNGTEWITISTNAVPNASTTKDGLMTKQDFTKLDDIEPEAQKNVQADFGQMDNTKDDYIKNKPNLTTIDTASKTIVPYSEDYICIGTLPPYNTTQVKMQVLLTSDQFVDVLDLNGSIMTAGSVARLNLNYNYNFYLSNDIIFTLALGQIGKDFKLLLQLKNSSQTFKINVSNFMVNINHITLNKNLDIYRLEDISIHGSDNIRLGEYFIGDSLQRDMTSERGAYMIGISDVQENFNARNVEGALAELSNRLRALENK